MVCVGDGKIVRLTPDRQELDRFVRAIFPYADAGTFVSLRGFDQFRRDVPPEIIRTVKVNGDLAKVIDAAYSAADDCANAGRPVVFAPPVCTFNNQDRARGIDLANGVALSVEIDEGDTGSARARLEGLIGPATVVMASGGVWADPETGEVHPKLHLHWRLNEPTREPDDHSRLRMARDIAAQLSGGDPTGKPVVHPLRWPGSWNQKDTRSPRLAKIIALNPDAEIDLSDAIEALTDAQEAAGMAVASLPQSSEPTAPYDLVSSAVAFIPNAGTQVHYDDWIKMGYAIHRATGGGVVGRELWDEWSAKSEKYEPTEQTAAWGRIDRAISAADVPIRVGAGTLFFLATRAGWERPQPTPPETPTDPGWWESLERSMDNSTAEVGGSHAEVDDQPLPQIENGGVIDPRDWTAPAPLRQWLIQDWIPIGYATGIYGDGGLGKSLLCQQLLTSVATGLPWLDMQTRAGPAFGFMCEDDPAELHRRQEAINRNLGIEPTHLEMLRYTSRLGLDNILMTFDDRNRPELTALFKDLVRFLSTFRPRLVVLDTLADIFGGEEVKRAHARQFVQGVAGNIARAFDCAVVVAAHPSASGLASGSGTSGNTAWSNTFRSRLYLTGPKDDDADPNTRFLERKKANYSKRGEGLTIKWEEGAFIPIDSAQPKTGLDWPAIHAVFAEVDAAWRRHDPWSSAPQTRKDGRYLPTWMAMTYGISAREAASIVEKWTTGGYLKTEIYDNKTKGKGLRVLKVIQP